MAMSTFFRLKLMVPALSAALAFATGWGTVASSPGIVDLVLRTVEVQTTKANGDSWDTLGGKPDLKVLVRRGRKRHLTSLESNAYEADFNAKTLRVQAGDVIEIVVRDQDVALDDEIGRRKMKVTADHIRQGRVTLRDFGRVKSVTLQFRH